MKRKKLKNKEDFLLALFTESVNREYFSHMRQRIKEALEDKKIIIIEENKGCLIWSIFKVNSHTYMGRKGDFQIKQIVVTEKVKGKGIAKYLFLSAKKIAEDNNCPRMVLTVREDNKRAQAFYEKMGMKKIKITEVTTRETKKKMIYAEFLLQIKEEGFIC